MLINEKSLENTNNMLLLFELCLRIDTALREGKNFAVPYYHFYAKPVVFYRWRSDEKPDDGLIVKFYGKKYQVHQLKQK